MKQKIIAIGKKLGVNGYSAGISGNISIRQKNGFYITSSGSKLSELKRNDIIFVDFDGNCNRFAKKPSSEKNLHLEIYKLRHDINAIIHCHSPKCTSLATCHIPMDKKLLADSVFYFGEIPLAPYAMPSSEELVKKTLPFFENHNAVLMSNHGIIIGADTLENALFLTETAELNAEVYINSILLKSPYSLSESDVSDIYNLRNSK